MSPPRQNQPKKQGEKKVSEVNKNKKEQECKECGAGQMVLDAEKAELYCDVCGITTPSKDVMDANAGKNTYGGEGVATHSPVRNDDNINANIGTSADLRVTDADLGTRADLCVADAEIGARADLCVADAELGTRDRHPC